MRGFVAFAERGTSAVALPRRTYALESSCEIEGDYAVDVAASHIRFGAGSTHEIGAELRDQGVQSTVAVFTDPNLVTLPPVVRVLESLARAGLRAELFADVEVEPTDRSFQAASAWLAARVRGAQRPVEAVVAVGGGSVIDTAKAANLYACYPDEFLAYVNPPIGLGKPPPGPLLPLIAVPTTAGTGSETTGVAIFDYLERNCKTGIAHRRLRPTLGIVDPENTATMPPAVAACSGFDVLAHALESYTAIPFHKRAPRPQTPLMRPAYQGSNPISDVWSLMALERLAKYFVRAVRDGDAEARAQMMLASTAAGTGFGSAGVHLCHGMSYPVSSLSHHRTHSVAGYPPRPMVPHGMSVVLHAPAVFRFTAAADPPRHLHAARVLGASEADVATAERDGAASSGALLADRVLALMRALDMPNGLSSVGVTSTDVDALVERTLPQHRVLKLSPRPVSAKDLHAMFSSSMHLWD